MLTTYKAKLNGDRLEWAEETPPSNAASGADVLVTLLPNNGSSRLDKLERGTRMKAALDRLAAMGGVASIPDPSAWQREIRQDKVLSGRED